MGLPGTAFWQLYNMFQQIPGMYEMMEMDFDERQFYLNQSCTALTDWDEWGFKLFFSPGNENYIIVPLAAFTVDDDGECLMMFTWLDNSNGNVQSDTLVLGSLFLQ